MDLSQYHTTLAHVAPKRRVRYGSVDQHAETPSDAGHSPSYTITSGYSSPVAGQRVDVACLYIVVAQQPQSHQTSLFENTPVFQTIETRKLRQSELGRPSSTDVDPPINLAVLACTRV